MKYLKSTGGYFYKEYANGKKKRISKKEFMKYKKQKKEKNKKYKMKGGSLKYRHSTNILEDIETLEGFLGACDIELEEAEIKELKKKISMTKSNGKAYIRNIKIPANSDLNAIKESSKKERFVQGVQKLIEVKKIPNNNSSGDNREKINYLKKLIKMKLNLMNTDVKYAVVKIPKINFHRNINSRTDVSQRRNNKEGSVMKGDIVQYGVKTVDKTNIERVQIVSATRNGIPIDNSKDCWLSTVTRRKTRSKKNENEKFQEVLAYVSSEDEAVCTSKQLTIYESMFTDQQVLLFVQDCIRDSWALNWIITPITTSTVI